MSVVIDKNRSHTERASIDKLHSWDKLHSRVTTWFKLSYMLSMSKKTFTTQHHQLPCDVRSTWNKASSKLNSEVKQQQQQQQNKTIPGYYGPVM